MADTVGRTLPVAMTSRALLSALVLLAAGLAGCDAIGGDDTDNVTGTWTGQVAFVADTLLIDPAVRIEYDIEETVELRLIHDDGLVRGTLSRSGTGTRIFRNADGDRDSSDVSSFGVLSHEVFGTYVDDRLQLEVKPRWKDHPTCGTETVPYANGLFTFDVSGESGQSQAFVLFQDDGLGSDDEPFTVSIRSEERLAIGRDLPDEPVMADVVSDPAELGFTCAVGGGTLRPTTPDAPAVTVTH